MRRGLVIALLTALGVALRVAVAHQDIFADELSTHFVVAHRGLGGVVSTVHTDAEITPPLYFVLAWLATRISFAPELLRLPSLVAGALSIPLVYAIGVRTIGRPAALLAAALTTLSPFMAYYSAEARGYALMVAFVLGSTWALLHAVEDRRARWWVLYAACAAGAVYSHYTAVFALAAQFAWVLVAQPESRRAVVLSTAGAVVAFLPWVSGLHGDLTSRTTQILSALQELHGRYVRVSLEHWALGYPFATPATTLRALPGLVGLILIGSAALLALAGWRRWRGLLDCRTALLVAMALSVPVGEVVASLLGSNLFGTRNLAAAWPYTALCIAAVLLAAGPRLGPAAAGLAVAGFAVAAVLMLGPHFRRPQYRDIARHVDATTAPGDVVVSGPELSPAGVPTAFDLAFRKPRRRFVLGQDAVRYDPFRILRPAPPIATTIRQAAAAARGHRLVLVLLDGNFTSRLATAAVPPGWRRVSTRRYTSLTPLDVLVYTATGA